MVISDKFTTNIAWGQVVYFILDEWMRGMLVCDNSLFPFIWPNSREANYIILVKFVTQKVWGQTIKNMVLHVYKECQ
jgi:hypothetical protein